MRGVTQPSDVAADVEALEPRALREVESPKVQDIHLWIREHPDHRCNPVVLALWKEGRRLLRQFQSS
jgi:hypothetical protein